MLTPKQKARLCEIVSEEMQKRVCDSVDDLVTVVRAAEARYAAELLATALASICIVGET